MISASDGVCINELTLNIISQCDVKHIMTLPIKTITAVLKVLTYIMTAPPIKFVAMLAIMTFIAAIILYISWQ